MGAKAMIPRLYKNLADARYAAVEMSACGGQSRTIYQLAPDTFLIEVYRKGDEHRQGFIEKVGKQ